MSMTYAPLPSAIPAPTCSTDIFDFLRNEKEKIVSEERIEVQEDETHELVAVTLAKPDGRVVRRQVPTKCWREKGYRAALIRSLSMLVA